MNNHKSNIRNKCLTITMRPLCVYNMGNAEESMVCNVVTTFCRLCINVVLQHLPTMRQRSKLHWSNVVCYAWAILVYNVEPTLDQRMNAIWVVCYGS